MKKCLIVANLFKKEASELAEQIKSFLQENNVECNIFSYEGNTTDGTDLKNDFKGNDFVITLGGDGTVLYASRECAPLNIPIFSVNLGEFGFLATVQKNSWKEELNQFLENKSQISQRNMLECEVIRQGKTVFKSNCMNDCIISSKSFTKISNFSVAYNHAVLGPFKTTGIIVSTPNGSTAYSAAAGGPIVDSSLDAMILTPVSSFSLSARPIVFSDKSEIAITVLPSRTNIEVTCDGQINFDLMEKDVVIVGIPKYKASLIGSTQEKFYAALQSKLNWSGGPRA